jgi:hypothetical protein
MGDSRIAAIADAAYARLAELRGITPPTREIKAKVKAESIQPQFVVSSHGHQVARRWQIPQSISLHFFTKPGQDLYCSRILQSQVCRREVQGGFHYTGPRPGEAPASKNFMDYDYHLTPDPSPRDGFHSGVVVCGERPILYLNTIAEGIWFSELILGIVKYCQMAGWPEGKLIHITGLFCRGGEDAAAPAAGAAYDPFAPNTNTRGGSRNRQQSRRLRKRINKHKRKTHKRR